MDKYVNSVHFVVIITAVMGGVLSILSMIGKSKKFLSKKNVDKLNYYAYGMMAISMFLWVLRGLISPE